MTIGGYPNISRYYQTHMAISSTGEVYFLSRRITPIYRSISLDFGTILRDKADKVEQAWEMLDQLRLRTRPTLTRSPATTDLLGFFKRHARAKIT